MTAHRLVVAALVAAITSVAAAELRLASVFGDHMVIQRDAPVRVWGWADPGQTVAVSLAGRSARATADDQGRWRAELAPLPAGGPHELTVESASGSRRFTDVLVGEVWLCSGQSNMEWALRDSDGHSEILASKPDPDLRLMRIEKRNTDEPQDTAQGTWARAESEALAAFSGVGYFMGARLRNELGVPVGLIQSAYGGSPAEAWTSLDTLSSSPALRPIVEAMHRKQAEFDRANNDWERRRREADAAGKPHPPRPSNPFGWDQGYKPTGLYNAMLRPLAPFSIAGAVWYQGESNVGRAEQYQTLLPAMIADWRDAFEHPEMPVGIVQLANYADPHPGAGSWAELREAQAAVADDDPDVGLVVTIDCGDPTDIHPTDKRTVGERLAGWALTSVYERPTPYAGPVLIESDFDGETVTLTFDTGGRGLATRGGEHPTGFVLSEGGWWRYATTEVIEGDTVTLQARWINNPIYVRYGWDNNPAWANLTDTAGLPARPFRLAAPGHEPR